MILGALRLFKSLSAYHYIAILITIFVPVIGPPAVDYFAR